MEFLFPYRLLWLLLLIPLLWYLARAERRRVFRLTALSVPSAFDLKRLLVPATAAALILLSLARPYSGFRDIQIETEGHDLVVAVDVSYSMLAADASPSRLEIAKRKIFDLIDAANRGGVPLRVGLVTFAGSAFRYCPITADLEIVRAFAESLSPEVMTSRGSSLENAIEVSIQVLAKVKAQHGSVLILTDGEDLEFKLSSVEETLTKSAVPVYSIGIGEPQGVPIPRGNGRYFTSDRGEIVISKLTEEPLRSIARVSGGLFQRADIAGRDIQTMLSRFTAGTSTAVAVKTVRSYHEIGSWFAAPILLVAAILLVARRESVLFALLLSFPFAGIRDASAQDQPAPSPRQAYDAYQSGDYETALRGFAAEHERSPQDAAAAQGMASALFKLKRYEEAAKLFDSIAAGATSGRERFEALYDSGNSHLMKQDPDAAISRYEQALKIKPKDIPATSNLEIARRLKEEKQKQQEQQHQSSKESSGGESSSQGSGGQNESSSATQDQSAGASSSASEDGSSHSSGQQSSPSSADSGDGGQSSSASSDHSQSTGNSSAQAAPTPGVRPTVDPLKALDSLEDRPLLPKQRRNRDTEPLTGQTW